MSQRAADKAVKIARRIPRAWVACVAAGVWAMAFLCGCGREARKESAGDLSSRVMVYADVDKTEVQIGEPVTLTLRADRDEEVTVEFPEPEDVSGEMKLVEATEVESREVESGRFEDVLRIKLVALVPRAYVLGPFPFTCRKLRSLEMTLPEGAAAETDLSGLQKTAGRITVQVASGLSGGEVLGDLRKPKGPVGLPIHISPLTWGAVIMVLVVLSAGGFVGFRRYVARVRRQGLIEAYRLPHEIALDELSRIERMQLPESGRFAEYYDLVSDCLRRYIEGKFGLRAPEMTSEEFIAVARKSDELNEDRRRMLEGYLNTCDLVKFAGEEPSVREARDLIKTTRRFVADTRPPEMEAARERELAVHAILNAERARGKSRE